MLTPLKEQVFISLILYVHNNETIIADTLDKLWDLLSNKFETFEFIIIDDASSDNTVNEIIKYVESKKKKKITLIDLNVKHGLENAMWAGLDFSIGDFVIELDSPQIHFDINLIYELYEKSCEGYDFVSVQTKTKQKFTSKIFYKLLNQFSNIDINLDTQIAHILTRRGINSISKIQNKTRYRKLLHIFSGHKKATLNVKLERKIESSYTISEKIKLSSDIIFSFTNLGLKLNIYIGFIFFIFSVFLGLYSIYQYLTYDMIIEGWTTIMLFLSFGFSGIFFVLSILNNYFSITLNEIRSTPKYTIKNINRY